MFLLDRSLVFAIFQMARDLWLVAMMVLRVMACRYSALPSSWFRPWRDTMVLLIASPSLHQALTLLLVDMMGSL